MKTRTCTFASLLLALVLACGCTGAGESIRSDDPSPAPLRVGISPDYPPLVFEIAGKITGVESDLAQLFAGALGRPLTFVPMRWEDLVPGLMAGTIDIVMSGMTVTPAREVQIAFAEPYLDSGLLACMRADDARLYPSAQEIRDTRGNVGVIPGSSADAYVSRHFPNARRIAVARAEHAALALKTRRIDLFVADAPAVVWLVSRNEADLAGYWELLVRERLAWGVRRGNEELLAEANAALARWKADGKLRAVLSHWLPYLDKLQ